MIHVLCYGDSNTYGFNCHAKDPALFRYAEEERWTGVAQQLLGGGYRLIEEGLGGRTTVFDDPASTGRSGLAWLIPCIQSHQPLELIVFMLGTNDCNTLYNVPASEIVRGMEALLKAALNPTVTDVRKPPGILLISPFHIKDCGVFGSIDHTSVEKSRALAAGYRQLAEAYGCHFLDAAQITEAAPDEGLHLTREGHRALGLAIGSAIRAIFS